MERQRREEWERGKKEELGRRREGEQEEISRLRAKKKSLELELEAVVRPHAHSRTYKLLMIMKDWEHAGIIWSPRATSTSRSQTVSVTPRARGGFRRQRWSSLIRRGMHASRRSTRCRFSLRLNKMSVL